MTEPKILSRGSGSTELFTYDYEFSTALAVGSEPRTDLALRVTQVSGTAPITFVMSDKWMTLGDETRFCEAYLDNGNPAIDIGEHPLAAKRPLLTAGVTVFLRDVPESWQTVDVAEELAELMVSCCRIDQGVKSREDLTEALSQVLDQVDVAERLLRRGRTELEVRFPWADAGIFLRTVIVADASVLSLSYDEDETQTFSGCVLVSAANRELLEGFTLG